MTAETEYNELKEITGILSHEINNILTALNLTTFQLLKSTPLNDPDYKLIVSSRRSILRLTGIHGLLELSSLSEKEIREKSREFNLEKLVQEQTEGFIDVMEHEQIGLKVFKDYREAKTEYVMMHRPLTAAIISTLAGNILNHAPTGKLSYMEYKLLPDRIEMSFENLVGENRENHGFGLQRVTPLLNKAAENLGGRIEMYRNPIIERTQEGKIIGYQNSSEDNPGGYDYFGVKVTLKLKDSTNQQQ